MTSADDPQTEATEPLRVLFCFGSTQNVYNADDAELEAMMGAISAASPTSAAASASGCLGRPLFFGNE